MMGTLHIPLDGHSKHLEYVRLDINGFVSGILLVSLIFFIFDLPSLEKHFLKSPQKNALGAFLPTAPDSSIM